MSNTISYMLKANVGQIVGSMSIWLGKAADHAKSHEIPDENFLAQRLYPDMFAMAQQVQTACDMAARGGARLAGVELPSFPDEEKTLSELAERAAKTVAFVNRLNDGALDVDPDSNIVMTTPFGDRTFQKLQYMANFVVPNVTFHTSMAYALLRQQGVPLGKLDLLAGGQATG
ncbi:MAG: DUF1993 domain-containing protein [Pseudomonadota bacterium]